MGAIKLYSTAEGGITEVVAEPVDLERTIQRELEHHLREYLGVKFLASEYSTGRIHGGRIDTLGIDSEYRPVIIEYKRTQNVNVVNQVLSYLSWLVEHKEEFHDLLVAKLAGEGVGKTDWRQVRLICIAVDFTKHDVHATRMSRHKVELIRYRKYRESLLLEWIDEEWFVPMKGKTARRSNRDLPTFEQEIAAMPSFQALFERLSAYTLGLGNDVWLRQRKNAADFRIGPNSLDFESIVIVQMNTEAQALEIPVDEDETILIRNESDLEKAKAWIAQSYRESAGNRGSAQHV